MRVHMIDANERLANTPGKSLRRSDADQERSDQTGAMGNRDRVDLR
jgi:hypothetical protein